MALHSRYCLSGGKYGRTNSGLPAHLIKRKNIKIVMKREKNQCHCGHLNFNRSPAEKREEDEEDGDKQIPAATNSPGVSLPSFKNVETVGTVATLRVRSFPSSRTALSTTAIVAQQPMGML
jgi:hypothetical protein